MDGKTFETIVRMVSHATTRRSTVPALGAALLGMSLGQPATEAKKNKKRKNRKNRPGSGDPSGNNAICCSYPCAGAGGILQLCIQDSTNVSECPPSFRGCNLYVAGPMPQCHGHCGNY